MSGRWTGRTLECGCQGDYRSGAVVCLPCPSHPVPYWSVSQLVRMFAPEEVRNAPDRPPVSPEKPREPSADLRVGTKGSGALLVAHSG